MRAFVVIKGNVLEATLAANLRGLRLSEPRETQWDTQGYVEAGVELLNTWLCETNIPVPPGGLLWWRPAQAQHEHGSSFIGRPNLVSEWKP